MAKKKSEGINDPQVTELIIQALETERGGVKIYETAIRCAVNDDLKEEWEEYHEQTTRHVELVEGLCETLGLDTELETPGRGIVRHLGESLVTAMEMALETGNRQAAQLVACECVVLAETKDHANWELIGELAKSVDGDVKDALKEAHEEAEEQEDEHLYHTAGWCRELWLESLGMKAVLPPPEEVKHVKSAIGAARAKHQRAEM